MQPKPCARCAQMPYISPGFICHTEGCRWAITAEMIRQPKESDMAEKMTCAQCGMPCEAGEFHPYAACLMFTACHDSDTVRANIAQPAQAVDVEAACVSMYPDWQKFHQHERETFRKEMKQAITRAIGNARADD